MIKINDNYSKLPGKVQNRFKIEQREKEGERDYVKTASNAFAKHFSLTLFDVDLIVDHLISRSQCQSFVTSVAPYQTFRKQNP